MRSGQYFLSRKLAFYPFMWYNLYMEYNWLKEEGHIWKRFFFLLRWLLLGVFLYFVIGIATYRWSGPNYILLEAKNGSYKLLEVYNSRQMQVIHFRE